MLISISENIKKICPEAALGVISHFTNVQQSSPELLQIFETKIHELGGRYKLSEIADIPHIKSTRSAYKALGKSPHEYRNAAESMLRRIVKGNGLYKINNVVEINNLISVSSGYSIGSYIADSLSGAIELRHAPSGEMYEGIGKSSVNIEHLPTLYDENSAFGNPSSDSQRAMIQPGSHNIISIIYSFDSKSDLAGWMDEFSLLLDTYCLAQNIQRAIVE